VDVFVDSQLKGGEPVPSLDGMKIANDTRLRAFSTQKLQ